jgi:uncharacterized protein (DUF1330 family)
VAAVFTDIGLFANRRLIMPAFVISQPTIHDAELMKQYAAKSAPLVASYGGTYVARTDEVVALDGSFSGKRIVVMQFPDVDHILRFWGCPEYQELKKLRHAASSGDVWMVPGLD